MINSTLGEARIKYNGNLIDDVDISQKFEFIDEVNELYHQYVSDNSIKGGNCDYDGGQNQHELYAFWDILSSLIRKSSKRHFTFLEIGGSMGLWPIILDVVCDKFDVSFDYTTVTWIDHNPVANNNLYRVQEYYLSKNKVFNIINADSTSDDAINGAKMFGPMYNFVFIDADHSYDFAFKDIKNYQPMCENILFFHDIRPIAPTSACGVYKAIQDSGIILDLEIEYIGHLMGIGAKIYNQL